MNLPDFENDGYDVLVRCGCVFLFAPEGKSGVPIEAISAASKLLSDEGARSFLSTRLSMVFGANLVAGTEEDLNRLCESQTVKAACVAFAEKAFSGSTGIRPEAPLKHWLGFGDVGRSSLFLVGHLTGSRNVLNLINGRGGNATPLPMDDSDLARCVQAIEAQTNLLDGFGAFLAACPPWGPTCQKIREQVTLKSRAKERGGAVE